MHAHDHGLLHDLALLRRPRVVPRREAMQLIAGVGAGLVLAACGTKSKDASASSTTTTAASTTGATTATGAIGAVPAETGGPFPADGTNGPDVLTASGVVRSDIRPSFGQYSGTAKGVPMTTKLNVVHAADGSPYPGAAIYVWHCDASGGYSLYSQGVTNQNYLRGVQAADASGLVTFTSVYPACYSGRWPHIHFEVFSSLTEATKAGSRLITSQIALLEATSKAVYDANSLYSQSVSNLSRVSLATDMVFSDGAELETPTMTGDPASGYTLAMKIGVR